MKYKNHVWFNTRFQEEKEWDERKETMKAAILSQAGWEVHRQQLHSSS